MLDRLDEWPSIKAEGRLNILSYNVSSCIKMEGERLQSLRWNCHLKKEYSFVSKQSHQVSVNFETLLDFFQADASSLKLSIFGDTVNQAKS